MKVKTSYGFSVDTELAVDAAESKVRELLKDEGFGVLTEIDVRNTLRDKLAVDFRPYRILGACNPPLAYRALLAEPSIGLLLPCNVVVEAGPAGGSRVSFLDPEMALGMVGNPDLKPIAADAAQRLHRVADRLAADAAG
ncbi:MAG TPA: DUF302 domain-containing protein [Candidatus Dormibacteraeota bacterium]|jgi:uncharacterized protein (DUF302 family)